MLSQDEAKFPLVPTLSKTLGVKGHRPIVGNDDNKDNIYLFGSLNLVSGALLTNTLRWSKNKKLRKCSMQKAFVKHLEHIAQTYTKEVEKVVLIVDNARWHRGKAVDKILKQYPHLELYFLPPYSPKLQIIERFWKLLRRRATHNRFFPSMDRLLRALRNSLSYYQTLRYRLLSLIERPQKKAKLAAA